MSWDHDKRVDDGIMRHPADSMAWKKFDELHPSFAAEPRNVRLGLASDGFQPFGMSKTPYNIWPVVAGLYKHGDSKRMEDLLSLSRGPMPYVTRFKGYIVNGYRFHVKEYDQYLKTQNCGVVVVGETGEEQNHMNYYGELTEVLELQFVGGRRVILFRCMWFDQKRGVKMDEYGFVSANRRRYLKINEQFVLASQASQVFYAIDHSNKGWHIVQKVQPRDAFDNLEKKYDDLEELDNSTQVKRKRTH
ncbi:hypothetical protein MTR67_048364 [Solanum verrucosum]|uniref:DUF4216 domain-containing protein n=1 Tax=Solanum verrucosum TaxID=315347 RepID=A0AAF0ZZZ0_SOLVR|nr:hypothetical protein MTR67_048364 [Solanum verrucosum]